MIASQTTEREIERLTIERDELAAAAKRVAASLQSFMDDTSDPGTEALAAQYELARILSKLSIDTSAIDEAQYLSQFSATPAEIHGFLANRLPEAVHLNYQQAIGEHVLSEAVGDAQMARASADNDGLYSAAWREGWDDAIERIDPDRNGPCPSKLIRFGEEAAR